jgi:2-polyprenyl-6-methoxyphenol hydroxylase-like FAD-dependent oxidoreductase
MSTAQKVQNAESILILGGGMGALAAALALRGSARTITIVERDEAPPELAPSEAFDAWKRSGVPQLRHTHIFLARIHNILRERHPELLAELNAVGVNSGDLEEIVPAGQLATWQTQPSDRELLHMWGRRATVEFVLRRHVARDAQVRFIHEASVERLLIEKQGQALRVRGALIRSGDRSQELQADLVIDALGVRSKGVEWLASAGAQLQVERSPSRCSYYCRHFVQTSSEPEPPRRGTGASLDYLVFGIFFAEANTFSIAITCPESESELLERLKRPDGFDEVARQIPVLRHWRERAEPISRVLGGAELQNRWNHFQRGRATRLLGFFPVGDSYIQTNPIYGRGCSSAFVQAHALADTLARTSDPAERAQRYHAQVWRQLRPHFVFCQAADAAFWARARGARGEAVSLRDRLANRMYESVFIPALEQSPMIAREWLKAQGMGEPSPPWVAVWMVLYMLVLWPLRLVLGAQRRLLPQVGPVRSEMLRACLAAETQREDAG